MVSDDFTEAFERYHEAWGYQFAEFRKDCINKGKSGAKYLVLAAMVYKDLLRDDQKAVSFIERELEDDGVVEDLKDYLLSFWTSLKTPEDIDLSLSGSDVFLASKAGSWSDIHPVIKNEYFKRLYAVERDLIIEQSTKDLENEGDCSNPRLKALPELIDLLVGVEKVAGPYIEKAPFIGMAFDMIELASILIREVRDTIRFIDDIDHPIYAEGLLKSICECDNCRQKREHCTMAEKTAIDDSFELSFHGLDDQDGMSCRCPEITLAIKELQHYHNFFDSDENVEMFKILVTLMADTILRIYDSERFWDRDLSQIQAADWVSETSKRSSLSPMRSPQGGGDNESHDVEEETESVDSGQYDLSRAQPSRGSRFSAADLARYSQSFNSHLDDNHAAENAARKEEEHQLAVDKARIEGSREVRACHSR